MRALSQLPGMQQDQCLSEGCLRIVVLLDHRLNRRSMTTRIILQCSMYGESNICRHENRKKFQAKIEDKEREGYEVELKDVILADVEKLLREFPSVKSADVVGIREDIKSVYSMIRRRNAFEILFNYPGLHAIWLHRFSHRLWIKLYWLARLFPILGAGLLGLSSSNRQNWTAILYRSRYG